jgi:hypothetical protein
MLPGFSASRPNLVYTKTKQQIPLFVLDETIYHITAYSLFIDNKFDASKIMIEISISQVY